MVKQVIIKSYKLHFREPFKIAYEEATEDEIIFLKLINEQGRVGWSSATCDSSVNWQKPKDLLNFLRKKLTPAFFEWPISQWFLYHQKIQTVFKNWPMAQAAVEIAILNLWAKQRQLSLWEFFGGYQKHCLLSFSIGIKDWPQTLVEVKKKLQAGYQLIKLKGGLNLAEDVEKILKVSRILPQSAKLLLDINQGYSFGQAKELLKKVKGSRLSLIEQPIAPKDWPGLKKLHQFSKIPIIADESAVTLEDCQKLLLGDYCAGLNVKLMKCGGPINFLQIYHLAKSLNKIIMIGCMYESAASLTMSAQLALGLSVDYADLDSASIDFYDDPAQGGVQFKRGRLYLGRQLTLK